MGKNGQKRTEKMDGKNGRKMDGKNGREKWTDKMEGKCAISYRL